MGFAFPEELLFTEVFIDDNKIDGVRVEIVDFAASSFDMTNFFDALFFGFTKLFGAVCFFTEVFTAPVDISLGDGLVSLFLFPIESHESR